MTHLIYNCALYVILSSALPLLVKVLGITNFDLLGNYGKIRWLGNYFLVFAVNILFGGASALCLFDRVTHRYMIVPSFSSIKHYMLLFQGSVGDLEEDLSLRHRVQGDRCPQARLLGQESRPNSDRDPETALSVQSSQVKR